jgi:hypothetical protein
MRPRERFQARQRARTGSHLPHRHLTMRSMGDCDLHFERPMVIWIDGVRQGTARQLNVTVEPDAYSIYV